MTLRITTETWAKKSEEQAANLPDDQKALVAPGDYAILAYREAGDHLIATLDPTKVDLLGFHPSGHNTWYFFKGHCEDPAGFGPNNRPTDKRESIAPVPGGHPLTLPGLTGIFYSDRPICPESPNFTWGEALHVDGQGRYRKPADANVTARIIASAKAMQAVRDRLGRPISINSWYRDPATNRRIGGATQSRHMAGDGVDFRVQGLSPALVYSRLDGWWGARGGLASSSVFTHIDLRGYRARWSYGF